MYQRVLSASLALCLIAPSALHAAAPQWSESAVADRSATERLAIALEHSAEGAYTEAHEWLEAAADAGSSEAKIHLGYFHQHGRGVEQDGERALEWLERGVEAGETGFALRLAWDYLEGELVDPHRERAEHWFQHAIEHGYHEAHLGLGSILLTDVVGGDERRADEARAHFEAALDEGLVLASYYLARMYREGLGVDRDPERAMHYLEIGAESGDPQISSVMADWLEEMRHEL
ncbi:sel1 repeat family protein [Aquisalimonas sp. 2447]|uniref:tetratricopeptide repeat protein n=1 Tax=Aquisalimonas sp. 2447 TaxID=2740807 RepID=UPI0014323C42|nr:tetratricopeptide repeat protein [Aquisalimonas sp. 2447]QIT54646.1 sel1 repeat family protein [Aquisalimonas sp. 2447]